MTQKNNDSLYMGIALRVAKESKCPRRQVGCVLLLESGTLSLGCNGFPAGQEERWNDGSVQNVEVTCAETNAVGKLLEEGISAKGATVYTSLSCCIMCAKLLVRAKVKKVIYKDEYRLTEGIEYLRRYGVEVEKFEDLENKTDNVQSEQQRTCKHYGKIINDNKRFDFICVERK